MSKGKEEVPDHWFEFIADTLKQVDAGIQGAFLKKFLRCIVGRDFTEPESVTHWEGILARQNQLTEKLGRGVTFKTAALDYFEDLCILRNPVLMEYGELKKLRYDAATDSLTGLTNRRMFDEFLDQAISRSTRYGASFALVLFDLRNFKSVNDVCGHAAGDELLRCVGRLTIETIRGSDIASRVGGDEFTILLPRAERPGSAVLVERIARRLEECASSLAPGVSVGIDCGVVIFPDDGDDAPSLLAAADKNLYASKQKVRERPADPAVPKQATAPPAGESSPPAAVEESAHDALAPVSPTAPDTHVATQESVQAFDKALGGRRFDRIQFDGTSALGIVRIDGKSTTVRVLDASRGGVCLLIEQTDLPETFAARLQVPMLPDEELVLRRIYTLPLSEGKVRVGCAFMSILDLSAA